MGYPTLDEIEIVNNLSNYYRKSELTLELMSKSDGDRNRSKVRSRLVVVKDGPSRSKLIFELRSTI